MLGRNKRRLGSLLLSLTFALSPFSDVQAYELTTSDIGAYRSDVIRRIFDAVKNSSSYSRTIIDLKIDSLGKISTCRIVKSSGDESLDAKMMDALSKVNLPPMKFASAPADFIQLQISFGNSVPGLNGLYLKENEALTYRGFSTQLNFTGLTPATTTSSFGPRAHILQREVIPEEGRAEYGDADKNYDKSIETILENSPTELSFRSLDYGLRNVPLSATWVENAAALQAKGRQAAAANAYVLALIEPIKNSDLAATQSIVDKISKLSSSLRGEDRLTVALSMLNLNSNLRTQSTLLHNDKKAEYTDCLTSVIAGAQKLAEDSSSKNMGRLGRYYRQRGDVLKNLNKPNEAKVSYQKFLSITLENEAASPVEIDQAFETTLTSLQNGGDPAAIREVENQRNVWLNNHPEPTNLRAIMAACSQLTIGVSNTGSSVPDKLVDRLINLIRTSSLNTAVVPDIFLPTTSTDIRNTGNRSEEVTRCLQKLVQANDSFYRRPETSVSASLEEQLLKETYKFALRTRYQQQMRAFQQLVEYLVRKGKAQEALVLCDLVATNIDTEESALRMQFYAGNSVEQLRIRALKALGRTSEVEALEAKIKTDLQKRTQTSIQKNIEVAEQRLAKAAPDSPERTYARSALIRALLSVSGHDNTEKAKKYFLESLQEFNATSSNSSSLYGDLTNQLTIILSKSTDPDLDFTTNSIEKLVMLQMQIASKSTTSIVSRRTASPLVSILDNASLSKKLEFQIALIRNLLKFSDQQFKGDDTNKLVLLRKLASLETRIGHTDSATKTNLLILSLMEKSHETKDTDLVSQLLLLANGEANVGNMTLAKKYHKRAATLGFVEANAATTNSLLTLGNAYATKGELEESSKTFLQAVKQSVNPNNSEYIVSPRDLIRACEARNDYTAAKEFFEGAINFEASRGDRILVQNSYAADFSNLLLSEYGNGKNSQAAILRRSDDLFTSAAAAFIAAPGQSSRLLGSAVQRRAYLLTLGGFNDQAGALLEKYKEAAGNSGGGTLIMDTNIGAPPVSPAQPTIINF